jgi:hypothetical protein
LLTRDDRGWSRAGRSSIVAEISEEHIWREQVTFQ